MGALRGTLRPLGLGAVLGLALALGRAPLGVDLISTSAVAASEAFAWRGFALAGVALVLGRCAGSRPRLGTIALGAALAFALHAALLSDTWRLEHPRSGWLVLAFALVGGWILRPRGHALLGPDEQARLGLVERLGWLVAGAGAAVALEAVARPLRLLGGAGAVDAQVFAGVFLALLAAGAVCFAGLVPERLRPAACALALVGGALACAESLRPLQEWSSRTGLDAFFRDPRWQLDLSHRARLSGEALMGLRTWILPAFALGAALAWATRGPRAGWIVFGAALGTALMPAVLTATAGFERDVLDELPSIRVGLGVALAAVGAATAVAGTRSLPALARWVPALLCAGAAGVVLGLPRARVLPLSPWENIPVQPVWMRDTAGGLLTVEHMFEGGRVVTLDRRRLTPTDVELEFDELALRSAWERVDPALREPRVLLIGQLTPARARVLRELGAAAIDRSASWHAWMDELEVLLFDGDPRPPGAILGARELARSGPWDLIVAPAVAGDAPVVRAEDPEQGPRVVWCSARSDLARRDWGERVGLSLSGLEDFLIAPRQPAGVRAARPGGGPAPWRRLMLREIERGQAQVAATLERLARGAADSEHAALAEGLALHAAAQRRSSPWESQAQAIELDARALELLAQAALAEPPDAFVRALWNELAHILVEKRAVALTEELLPELARRWAPWWQLERALARASLELLDPDGAAESLLRVVAERPLDLDARLECAVALSMAGRPAEAVAQLEAIEAVQPDRRDVRRLLAMELARLGDARAGPLLERLLAEDPDDEQLRAFQGPGPYPAAEVRFQVHGGLEGGADDGHDH
jgi:tetratricopeptide (TPR) repeat protein